MKGYLLPPKDMITLVFLKKVLTGEKLLLKTRNVGVVPDLPKIPEINTKKLWVEFSECEEFIKFFPDVYIESKRTP